MLFLFALILLHVSPHTLVNAYRDHMVDVSNKMDHDIYANVKIVEKRVWAGRIQTFVNQPISEWCVGIGMQCA